MDFGPTESLREVMYEVARANVERGGEFLLCKLLEMTVMDMTIFSISDAGAENAYYTSY